MKKKLVGVLLSAAMVVSSLAACGGSTEEPAADNTQTEEPAADTEEEAPADTNDVVAAATMEAPDVSGWDASKEIYAYSWNGESNQWLSYIIGPTDADGNKIVADGQEEYAEAAPHKELAPFVHCINLGVSGTDGEYQKLVDTAFTSDKYPSIIPCDDTVALYYIQDDDKTLDLHSVGLTDEMYANAYQYTKDYANWNGQLKGVTPQATPGNFTYRASIAKEVLGSDDPADVQAAVADWDKFYETADKMKAAGYAMLSGPDDVKYALMDQRKSPWVTVAADGSETLTLDDSVKDIIESEKKLYDGDYTKKTSMWAAEWSANFEGDVFGYFGCTWFVYWCIATSQDSATSTYGDWRVCEGPVGYHWGGSYFTIGKDTPNPELCAYLMYELCCDKDIMYNIEKGTSNFVNNKEAVTQIIADGIGASDILGGQNPVETWANSALQIDLSNATYLDNAIMAEIDKACQAYNSGEVSSVDDAIKMVKDNMKKAYDYLNVE